MPKVKTKSGKVKHYPYTKKGKAAAKKAMKRAKK
jgi:ribosomal protein L35